MEIRVEGLSFSYDSGTPLEVRALEDVSFRVGPGEVLGIIGGTGSGKTTLVRLIGGLVEPTAGTVVIDGRDTRELGPGLKRRVGVVFQSAERCLFKETVFEEVSFALRRFSGLPDSVIEKRVADACAALGLDLHAIGQSSPSTLSSSDRRKVAVAAILAGDSEALLLDEPAVDLDPPGVADLVEMLRGLRAASKTILIVSHDMDPFLQLLDLVLVLHRGRMVAFGRPGDVWGELAGETELVDLLPGQVLLAVELRKAGIPVGFDDLSSTTLAESIADHSRERGERD